MDPMLIAQLLLAEEGLRRATRPQAPPAAASCNPAQDNDKQRLAGRLIRDCRGATIVEAAIALPMIIILLLGAISYGAWFMAAHSVQQAANEGARAALAGLDDADRDAIVSHVVETGVLDTGTVDADLIAVSTSLDQNLYTVRVTYDASSSMLLNHSLIPLPASRIVRTASVRLNSI